MAAIPREETARLIDRCWAAACEEGKRISSDDCYMKKCRKWRGKGQGNTRTSIIDFDFPTHVCKSDCSETTDGASADYDEFFRHGGSVSRWDDGEYSDALYPHLNIIFRIISAERVTA